ncbi:MAG: NADH-quinone oxidoreductase subunit H [Sedimentisphaerales bacterium]|nr:NADH-quinone oxidoreductase subunit H [Sedimentisphaerales bacterium]
MHLERIINLLLVIVLSPLIFGIINRTKAIFAGRTGQPLLQSYYDLWKLFNKGAVYSQTTSWVFRLGPIVGLAVVFATATLVPLGRLPAVIAFDGDIILFAYLFGLMRFFTVISALDTGSAFEGMGASREVMFSALAEPAFLIGLAAISAQRHSLSLTGMFTGADTAFGAYILPVQLLVSFSIFIVFLAENSRIPVDDPNTHLELTMIHEVMVLDNSGPDFGFITYSSALKMWLLGAVLVGVLVPSNGNVWIDMSLSVVSIFVLAVLVGIVESSMARLKLLRVPQLLLIANALSILALILVLR